MKRLSISIIIVFSFIVTSYATSWTPDKAALEAKAIQQAEDKLREFVPILSELENKFPEDPQVLLGLATIYSRHSPSFEYSKRCVLLYRKAVALEPSNMAARVGMIKRTVSDFISHRGQLLEALRAKQEYAKEKNLKEVEIIISWDDEIYKLLCELLGEESQEKVIIRDFNESRLRVCEKFDHNLPPVIAELDEAEKSEPDNAVYNYLLAQLYFDLDKDEKGLEELEKGSRKPYFNTYLIETTDARKRVLREAGFPENYRLIIEENIPLPWGIPGEDKVFKIARQDEKSGNFKRANGIYETIIRISNQYEEEPIPGKAGQEPGKQADRKFERRFERIARERLNDIQEKQNK